MVDPGPLKALSDNEESHESDSPTSRSEFPNIEKYLLIFLFIFLTCAQCAGK